MGICTYSAVSESDDTSIYVLNPGAVRGGNLRMEGSLFLRGSRRFFSFRFFGDRDPAAGNRRFFGVVGSECALSAVLVDVLVIASIGACSRVMSDLAGIHSRKVSEGIIAHGIMHLPHIFRIGWHLDNMWPASQSG